MFIKRYRKTLRGIHWLARDPSIETGLDENVLIPVYSSFFVVVVTFSHGSCRRRSLTLLFYETIKPENQNTIFAVQFRIGRTRKKGMTVSNLLGFNDTCEARTKSNEPFYRENKAAAWGLSICFRALCSKSIPLSRNDCQRKNGVF